MNRPSWTNEAIRRARLGQSALYIANAMGITSAEATRIVRPLNRRGRLHDRPSRPGRAT